VSFAGDIGTLLSKIEEHEEDNRKLLSQIQGDSKALTDSARRMEASSSGSNFGYHSELYYRDFETPPAGHRFNIEWGSVHGSQPGWGSKTSEEVKNRIERISGREFEKLEHDSAQLVESSKQLLDDILIALAPLHSASGLTKEKELLNQLESFDWAEDAKNKICIAFMKQFPNMTRDSNAIIQGQRLPAYTYYEAVAEQAEQSCDAVERFWKVLQRLLKQLQVQQGYTPPSQNPNPLDTVRLICRRFHAVATQLSARHQKRPTLTISDEYDVQDLWHALLRLNFEDVRPEESTPSFGGGAARMDFLLKKEQIVVEPKMTRADLRDKALSDQLIQDVARYGNHPDCRKVVFFVYDPQGFVKNPNGVISDIQKLSSEKLSVEVIIVPER
jgi:hypothetical protein